MSCRSDRPPSVSSILPHVTIHLAQLSRLLRRPAFQLAKNRLPTFFQIVVVLHFCLLLGDAKPTRNLFPRAFVLSRQPNFFCPRIHAACYLPGGNIAFELLGPSCVQAGLEPLKITDSRH